MKRTSVTLIGMGPRGLSVLERIAAFARGSGYPLQVNLVDPGECGPGAHGMRLPQHLLVNSPAGEVTIFPARQAVELAPSFPTPSLIGWARAQGYRRFGQQVHQADDGGEELADSDCLPRCLLGRYLAWAYGQVCAAMPPTVALAHLRHRAIDMFQQPDGSFVIELDSGYSVNSDFVFLTTGTSRNNLTDEQAWCRKFAQDHARYNSRLAYIRHPGALGALGSDAQVGIQGLGLTAHDVLAELTVGRGGTFTASGSGLRYERSGLEPQLMLFSRSCLPALARPVHTGAPRRPLHFLTLEAVRGLREKAMRERASTQLDFDRDLLPLLVREMAYAWRCALSGNVPAAAWYEAGADEQRAILSLLFPLRGRSFESAAEFNTFFTCLLADDLCEARRGARASPAKAAAEVLLEARPVFQDIVEHGGLCAQSHRKFLSVYNPAFNRIAGGPPCGRNEQLLALVEAGVLRVAAGPNCAIRIDEERSQFALHTRMASASAVEYLDAIVVARQEAFSPETDDAVFMRNLLKRGTVRPCYNGTYHPGGLDIDLASHPVSRAGRVFPNLWAVGCLTEGAHYSTNALPRPHVHARPVRDADRCVRDLFSTIAERDQAARKARPRREAQRQRETT